MGHTADGRISAPSGPYRESRHEIVVQFVEAASLTAMLDRDGWARLPCPADSGGSQEVSGRLRNTRLLPGVVKAARSASAAPEIG